MRILIENLFVSWSNVFGILWLWLVFTRVVVIVVAGIDVVDLNAVLVSANQGAGAVGVQSPGSKDDFSFVESVTE